MIERWGAFVLVVGPSGAGKDTLIAHAQRQLALDSRFVFPKRLVTRQPTMSVEDHETLSREAFERMRRSGDVTLAWEAHGLGYVIPKDALHAFERGHIVVCNVSRGVVAHAVETYPWVEVAIITANRSVRAARLSQRGRESVTEVEARLAREVAPVEVPAPCHIIDNSGPLEESAARFVEVLLHTAQPEVGA